MSNPTYPPPGSIVIHDGSHYLFAGTYGGLPGWGTVLPELHSGEFDPHRERIVRLSRLVAVDPMDECDLGDEDVTGSDTPDWIVLTDVLEQLRQQAAASDSISLLRGLIAEIKTWETSQYRATGKWPFPKSISTKLQELIWT